MAVYRRGKTWWFASNSEAAQGSRILRLPKQDSSHSRRGETQDGLWNGERDSEAQTGSQVRRLCRGVPGVVKATAQAKDARPACMELQNAEAVFGGKYLDEITTEMVENFKSARKHEVRKKAKDGRLVTGTTVNRALETLKAMYYQAERMGYFVKNPVVGVQMFRQPLDSMRVITFDEQAAYLAERVNLYGTSRRSCWIRA